VQQQYGWAAAGAPVGNLAAGDMDEVRRPGVQDATPISLGFAVLLLPHSEAAWRVKQSIDESFGAPALHGSEPDLARDRRPRLVLQPCCARLRATAIARTGV